MKKTSSFILSLLCCFPLQKAAQPIHSSKLPSINAIRQIPAWSVSGIGSSLDRLISRQRFLCLSQLLFSRPFFFYFFLFFLAVLFPGWTVFCFCAQADCPGVRSFSAFLFSRHEKQNPEQRKPKKVRKNAQGKRQKRLMLSA
ncbi:hypothetical protein AAK899_04055 [Erysipelotrichaceae bacterium 51-3]